MLLSVILLEDLSNPSLSNFKNNYAMKNLQKNLFLNAWQVLIIVSRPGNDGLTKEYSRNSGKILKTFF